MPAHAPTIPRLHTHRPYASLKVSPRRRPTYTPKTSSTPTPKTSHRPRRKMSPGPRPDKDLPFIHRHLNPKPHPRSMPQTLAHPSFSAKMSSQKCCARRCSVTLFLIPVNSNLGGFVFVNDKISGGCSG